MYCLGVSGEFRAYDALPYAGEAYPQTHPSALFSAAWLLGMSPAEPRRCRVLELGCADGTNLIAMAAGLPQSTFVGIDGSAVQVASGQALIDQAGLENVTLQTADLRSLGSLGTFDYIIAHGVYSWVAADAQAALLSLCADALAPQGVAYVSYNALPGWHSCRMVRDLMRYHSRKFDTIPEQLRQARAVLRFVAESAIGEHHAATLSAFVPYLDRIDDDYLFHDYLEENNQPMLAWDFAQDAAAAGLAYLGDAELHRMAGLNLPETVRAAIEGFTDDPLRQEQYLDFITDRTLRRTLLCRPGMVLQRDLELHRAHRLCYSSGLVEVEGSDPVCFRHRRTQDAVVITDPVHLAALRLLQAQAPRPVPFSALAAAAPGSGLEGLLLQGVLQGVIQPHSDSPPVTSAIGLRPEVWWLARLQAASGRSPSTRLHQTLPLTSAIEPLVISHLDGTRTVAELQAELLPLIAVDEGDPAAALSAAIAAVLERCARAGLLIRGPHET